MKRNGYVQSMSLYADIQMYNLSSHLGPPIRRGVPTQMFPTFLDVPSKVSYDILTYNTLQNYPSVEGAYPLGEPTYSVRKCPENKIIKPLIKTEKVMETLPEVEMENSPFLDEDIENLDIMLFIDMNCPFSQEQMKSNFIEHMDIKKIDKNNNKMLKELGGKGTPFFYSQKTKRFFTGLEKDKKEIIKKLLSKENFEVTPKPSLSSIIKDLKIVIYSSDNCPYCKKLEKMLEEEEVEKDIQIIKDQTKMKDIENIQGFPYIFSKRTDKNMVGCPVSVQMIIDNLSEDTISKTKI